MTGRPLCLPKLNTSVSLGLHNGTVYYNPKLDGELDSNDIFYIVSDTGDFNVHKSSSLKPGTYKVSIECKSAGKLYRFPDAIEIVMSK